MDIALHAKPYGFAVRSSAQSAATNPIPQTSASAASSRDEVIISPAAREALQKADLSADLAVPVEETGSQTVAFTSFADEFGKITDEYAEIIRAHYAREHEQNLTYDNPDIHIWDKYKNAASPDFRSDLSADERAWAYDQELDMLNGGKHLQMSNPYAFAALGGAPDFATAANKALTASRNQMNQAIQDLFTANSIEIPTETSFRLTVDQTNYYIKVEGLADGDLTKTIEQVLNNGDNGKNLYNHLKLTTPDEDVLRLEYADGHLSAVNNTQELDLDEVKKQAGSVWARYSTDYDPHKKAMNDKILSLNPDSPFNTLERMDRLSAAVRVGAPELVAEFSARKNDTSLLINKNREVDPDGSIALKTYMRVYAQPTADTSKTLPTVDLPNVQLAHQLAIKAVWEKMNELHQNMALIK